MTAGKITFQQSELSSAFRPTFLSRFSSKSAAQIAASLLGWAQQEGLSFRPGEGLEYWTEYVVVPPSSGRPQGAPLLTLEQGTMWPHGILGQIHVPFSRLAELGYTTPATERGLFDAINRALAPSDQMTLAELSPDVNGKYYGKVNYIGLLDAAIQKEFAAALSRFRASL